MHVLVCIKQVPDTQKVRIDPERGTLIRKGVPSITNPFDETALELALEIRESVGGRVSVLTMGIPDSECILRDALTLGADDAYLLTGSGFAGADTLATSYALSLAIEKTGPFGRAQPLVAVANVVRASQIPDIQRNHTRRVGAVYDRRYAPFRGQPADSLYRHDQSGTGCDVAYVESFHLRTHMPAHYFHDLFGALGRGGQGGFDQLQLSLGRDEFPCSVHRAIFLIGRQYGVPGA